MTWAGYVLHVMLLLLVQISQTACGGRVTGVRLSLLTLCLQHAAVQGQFNIEYAGAPVDQSDTPAPTIGQTDCSADPSICQYGGTCDVTTGVCACAAGYTGIVCQTNIDECSSAPCPPDASCVDGVDGYSCTAAGAAFDWYLAYPGEDGKEVIIPGDEVFKLPTTLATTTAVVTTVTTVSTAMTTSALTTASSSSEAAALAWWIILLLVLAALLILIVLIVLIILVILHLNHKQVRVHPTEARHSTSTTSQETQVNLENGHVPQTATVGPRHHKENKSIQKGNGHVRRDKPNFLMDDGTIHIEYGMVDMGSENGDSPPPPPLPGNVPNDNYSRELKYIRKQPILYRSVNEVKWDR